jgi:hypothetical protein
MNDPLEAIVDAIAARVAAKVLDVLRVPAPARVLVVDVANHGAPSERWVRDQARRGRIEIHGPRGVQYVDGGALAELLANTTIRRRQQAQRADESTDFEADAVHAVAAIAARRGPRGRSA